MRLHTLIFSCRSITAIIIEWNFQKNPMLTLLNVFVWHGLADLVSHLFHDPDNGTTIRGTLESYTPPLIRYGNLFASISQFFAIGAILKLGEFSGDEELMIADVQYLILIPIQISVFLFTLYKKGLISKMTQMIIYIFTLFPLFSFLIGRPMYFLCTIVIVIGRIWLNLDKYVLYIIATLISVTTQWY